MLTEASEKLRGEMEALALQVLDVALTLPPLQLLGWIWAMVHMRILADLRKKGDKYRPDKARVGEFQFALEYLHAVWSCHATLAAETTPFDEPKASELMGKLEELKNLTFSYCFANSLAKHASGQDEYLTRLEYEAKSAWVIIRGHRYQVLEGEFFRYVLGPHADALLTAYGMEPNAIAEGVQAIANTVRSGVSEATQRLMAGMDRANALVSSGSKDMGAAIEALKAADGTFSGEMAGAIEDVFHGGICNLSRHSGFTATLLDDLSFRPGENAEFFGDGDFRGTPLRTLPGRVRPGIKLGSDYYFTDGQFVRDSAYRTIQRGLLARLPEYREDWKARQQELVETAFPRVCARQFGQTAKHYGVFYPDVTTGEWAECDLVMVQDDVLVVVEAKAGAMPMHSPETNFERFERLIRELVLKAYAQCKRFLDYLASAPEVQIYGLVGGKHVAVARLRLRDFRTILPIGLTVEAFTPFSAMVKARPDIKPLLGRHPFISMSVDDLFVLNRFLPTTGELLHYLEVRQRVAGFPAATIFDEMDHLGAYIGRNRFDMEIEEHLKEVDVLLMDSFCDVVDRHFEGHDWETSPVPRQQFPEELAAVLAALDARRPPGWLMMDSLIRDQGGGGRDAIAETLAKLWPTLHSHPARRFLLDAESPIEIWMCRDGMEPSEPEVRRSGQIGCLVANKQRVAILVLSFVPTGGIADVACRYIGAPTVLQVDYTELAHEAERRRTMVRPTDDRNGRRSGGRPGPRNKRGSRGKGR
jgi:hypothetical protein